MENQPNFIEPKDKKPETVSTVPANKMMDKRLGIIILVLAFGYFVFAFLFGIWPFGNLLSPLSPLSPVATLGSPAPAPSDEFEGSTSNPSIYDNKQYGFTITLSAAWNGYSIQNNTWEGRDIESGTVTEHGPLIILRHPQWTFSNPREDMPVMVFTPRQWALIDEGKLSVGAAPIPPSILGQNSQYIMALPARYNYDYKTGWEEVDQSIHTLKAFEPITK